MDGWEGAGEPQVQTGVTFVINMHEPLDNWTLEKDLARWLHKC